jgi:hypothetical protein
LPARAGIIFNRHPKQNPTQQVPVLINTARSDQDDRRRGSAVQELREYDPTAYPEIVPTLIAVAQSDPRSSVRLEALQSLARLRPVSQAAGQAIQRASENDGSIRVRLQARTMLWQYHLSGYRGPGNPDGSAPGAIKTDEPPLADPQAEPPLAVPGGPAVSAEPSSGRNGPWYTSMSGPRPLPRGPAQPPLVPVNAPQLAPTPLSSGDDGPALTPPQ